MIIDTHAHINDDRLIGEADSIAADMESDNLEAIINIGYDGKSSEKSVELSEKHERIFAAVGLHPHDASKAAKELYDSFASWCGKPKTVAFGEIGLDFFYDLSPRDVQEKVFLEQLELAHFLKMPVVIHLRDAYGLMLKLLKENAKLLDNGAVLHCYSGSVEMVREFSRLDLYYSFGGAITFKNATEKPAVLKACPTDRILLETDCPYMTPVPHRGKVNYPKYVNLVAQRAAEILSLTPERVAEITTENAKRLFPKMAALLP